MTDTIKIIFDLDGVALAILPENYEILHRIQPNLYLYFMRNTAFFTDTYPQCVLPGFIELIQFIFLSEAANWIELSFFSAGKKDRNKQFITTLLQHALGREMARRVLPSIDICSREHCKKVHVDSIEMQRRFFGIDTIVEDYKKDILHILKKQDMSNALIIDDHPEVVYPGQERNYCAIPSASIKEFYTALRQPEQCESAKDILFQKLNNVFYIAGMLQLLLTHLQAENIKSAAEKKIPITEVLFKLQFKETSSFRSKTYAPQFSKNFSQQEFYNAGLEMLRKHNPALHFVTAAEISAFIQEPPSKEEYQHLEKYITRNPSYYQSMSQRANRPTTNQSSRPFTPTLARYSLFHQSTLSSKTEAQPSIPQPLPKISPHKPAQDQKSDEQPSLRKSALASRKFRR